MFFNIEKTLIKTEPPMPPYMSVVTYSACADTNLVPGGFDRAHIKKPD